MKDRAVIWHEVECGSYSADLPLWDRLPSLAYWTLPSLVGVPLILRALAQRRLLKVRSGSPARPGSGVPPGRPD